MNFGTKEKAGVVIISLEGEMMGGPDAARLAELFHHLINEGNKQIIINLEKVDRMNSSGLGILIGGLTAVRNQGGDIKLLHVGKKPRALLQITKLDCIFEIYDDEDTAIGSYTGK